MVGIRAQVQERNCRYGALLSLRGWYEPPSTCVIVEDVGDELLKEPLDFQMVGKIKKQRGMKPVSFWLPQAPPGYVPLACVACRGSPKSYYFSSLRCIRSDMVTLDKFSEESVWDTNDAGLRIEPFSIWTVGGEFGTFIVRSGYKKPPKRLFDRYVGGEFGTSIVRSGYSEASQKCH